MILSCAIYIYEDNGILFKRMASFVSIIVNFS